VPPSGGGDNGPVGMVVRRLGVEEWRLLKAVRLRALADAPEAFGSTLADELAQADDWWVASAQRLAWFTAASDAAPDEPYGLVAGTTRTDAADAREVISMWVAPARRGRRVADALLDRVGGWARSAGATTLVLAVVASNERALGFYRRQGFTPTGAARPLRRDPTVSAVELSCPLRPACLRLAPTSSGLLHVGHVRNAVLTWVLARQLGARYFVRFEDTDTAKRVAGSTEAVIDDLGWLGLLGREPPHHQAGLTDAHRAALAALASTGRTYADGGAVRFRIPADGDEAWDDLVRGPVAVPNRELADPVLVRRSGQPTFPLASTVDDLIDGVTHLVRGEPLLRATAVQRHLWRALGADVPTVGHTPLVVGADRRPLRVEGGEGTVRALRELGISPAAVVGYLAVPSTASRRGAAGDSPEGLDGLVERVELRSLSRRPFVFNPQALARLDRHLGGDAARRRGAANVRSAPGRGPEAPA